MADDKVIVLGPARPLEGVLRDLAELFNDQWEQRTTPDGGVSYVDAHYVELGPTVSGITLGTPFVDTPKWSGSVSMSYRFNFDTGAKLTPRS